MKVKVGFVAVALALARLPVRASAISGSSRRQPGRRLWRQPRRRVSGRTEKILRFIGHLRDRLSGSTVPARSRFSTCAGQPPPEGPVLRKTRAPKRNQSSGRFRSRNAPEARDSRRPRRGAYEVAVIVIPPRAFCLSVTRTLSGSSASATSSRILTASASQKCPSFR